MISDDDKERVRQATDFFQLVSETVQLRRRGSDWWGCCPFHHEKTPSFHINPSTGLWKCFGCGLGGDVYDYVMKRENLEFVDAIRFLADRAGIELVEERGQQRGPRRNRLLECMSEAESFYSTMLNRGKGQGPAEGRAYLAGRGFGSAVCRRWGLGYAPGHGMLVRHLRQKGFTNQEMEACDLAVYRGQGVSDRFYERVMFPIRDEQGRTIAFGGRVLGDQKPKYLNTKDTPVFHKGKHLFAFDKAKEHIAARGEAIVCEGYTDVMAMHEAGFPIAVAALGTSFSIDHVRTLARFAKRIVCMFDGDAAGQRAAERAIQFLDKSEADLRCVVLPNGQDPAEFLADHTSQELQAIIDAAEPLMDFVLRQRLQGVGPTAPAGARTALLDSIAQVLVPLKQSVLLDEYSLVVGDWLGFSSDVVKQAIRSKKAPRDNPANFQAPAAAAPYDSAPGPYDDYGYEGYAQEAAEYLPAEAAGYDSGDYAPAPSAALDANERQQLQAERELLSLMAAHPDDLRLHADRIATFLWADERHEAMAWAMLATPENTVPADVVAAASQVVPDAPRILSSGRVAAQQDVSSDAKVAFVLDTCELYSTRRRISDLRARMRSGDGDAQKLFRQATELQQRANELAKHISSGFSQQ